MNKRLNRTTIFLLCLVLMQSFLTALSKKASIADFLYVAIVYNGKLVSAEIDLLDNQKIIRSYTWGLDPAGTKQQIGGIGALLTMEETQPSAASKEYHYIHDAGGNVTNLVESKADGTIEIANSYEYGPFGQVIAETETVDNPFQYNTKYNDEETGLVYYGYRFYDAGTGRWLNQDPIAERGGINVYNSVSNNMVNGFTGGMSHLGGMNLRVGLLVDYNGLDAFGYIAHWHHIIPQALLRDPIMKKLIDSMVKGGFDFHLKENGWLMKEKAHLKDHKKYSKEICNFLKNRSKKGIKYNSTKDLVDDLKRNARKFNKTIAFNKFSSGVPANISYTDWKKPKTKKFKAKVDKYLDKFEDLADGQKTKARISSRKVLGVLGVGGAALSVVAYLNDPDLLKLYESTYALMKKAKNRQERIKIMRNFNLEAAVLHLDRTIFLFQGAAIESADIFFK